MKIWSVWRPIVNGWNDDNVEEEGQTPSLIQLSETFKQANLINFLIREALKTLEKGSSLIYLSSIHPHNQVVFRGELKRNQGWSMLQKKKE